MTKISNKFWAYIERDGDGDYHLEQRSTSLQIFMWNEEMRALLEGVYEILAAQDIEQHGEIDGVTR